jgi:hypothetical protein
MKFAIALAVFLAAFLTGCASQVVPTTGPHPQTSPRQIMLYQKAPQKYEILGSVTQVITPDLRWDAQGDATQAINLLKQQAGALGANGLLFQQGAGGATFSATAGYQGQFYEVPLRGNPTTAIGIAIFVVQ